MLALRFDRERGALEALARVGAVLPRLAERAQRRCGELATAGRQVRGRFREARRHLRIGGARPRERIGRQDHLALREQRARLARRVMAPRCDRRGLGEAPVLEGVVRGVAAPLPQSVERHGPRDLVRVGADAEGDSRAQEAERVGAAKRRRGRGGPAQLALRAHPDLAGRRQRRDHRERHRQRSKRRSHERACERARARRRRQRDHRGLRIGRIARERVRGATRAISAAIHRLRRVPKHAAREDAILWRERANRERLGR